MDRAQYGRRERSISSSIEPLPSPLHPPPLRSTLLDFAGPPRGAPQVRGGDEGRQGVLGVGLRKVPARGWRNVPQNFGARGGRLQGRAKKALGFVMMLAEVYFSAVKSRFLFCLPRCPARSSPPLWLTGMMVPTSSWRAGCIGLDEKSGKMERIGARGRKNRTLIEVRSALQIQSEAMRPFRCDQPRAVNRRHMLPRYRPLKTIWAALRAPKLKYDPPWYS